MGQWLGRRIHISAGRFPRYLLPGDKSGDWGCLGEIQVWYCCCCCQVLLLLFRLCSPLFQPFLSPFLSLLLPYFVFSFSWALGLAPLLLSCGVAVSFCSKLPILSVPVLTPHLQWLLAPRSNNCPQTRTLPQQHRLMTCTSRIEPLKNEPWNSLKLPLKWSFGGSFGVWFSTGPLSYRVQKVEPQCQLSKHENLASLSNSWNIAFLTSDFNMTLQYYLSNLIVRTSLLMFYLFLNNSETQDRELQCKYWSMVNLQVLKKQCHWEVFWNRYLYRYPIKSKKQKVLSCN